MVGAIPGDVVMHERPVGRGYVELRRPRRCPGRRPPAWRHRALATSSTIRASRTWPPACAFAYRVQRGHGIDGQHDGVLVHNLLASYAHLRSAAGSGWAPRFVDFVRRQRAQRATAASALAVAA